MNPGKCTRLTLFVCAYISLCDLFVVFQHYKHWFLSLCADKCVLASKR